MGATPSSFERTVLALCETIVHDRHPGAADLAPQASEPVAHFLVRCHGSMPDYLRLPLRLLTLVFAFSPLPRMKAPFYQMSTENRGSQLRAWRDSRLGFRRDLIKFYETLTVFGLYAELYAEDYASGSDREGTDG